MSRELEAFVKERKTLYWDIPAGKLDQLSESAILSRVLSYGEMKDVSSVIELIGLENSYKLFSEIKKSKRNNLSPKTINYFNLYFKKYVS